MGGLRGNEAVSPFFATSYWLKWTNEEEKKKKTKRGGKCYMYWWETSEFGQNYSAIIFKIHSVQILNLWLANARRKILNIIYGMRVNALRK